jgi:aralkylamine N-acetyltransferase
VEEDIAVLVVRSWDEEEIAALYKAGGWWKEEYKAEDLHDLIQGSFAFVVATDTRSGHAIGMGRVIADGVSDGYIQDLVVLPGYQKNGVGTRIVNTLVCHCLEAGVTWIGLIAEPDTENFYLPLGFHPMERHVPLLFRGES